VRPERDKKLLKMNKWNLWSPKEEAELLEEIASGLSIYGIAEKHQRTSGGINARINKIAYEMYTQGMDIDFISNKTKLSISSINTLIHKKENKETKETKDDEIKKLKEMINTLIENQSNLISIINNLTLK
jgi:methyl-accepting chemotaxis protein